MTGLAPIAIVAGETPAERTVAGATRSLLTAVGRAVDECRADADLAPYAAVVATSAAAWRTVRRGYAGPVLVVDADLLTGDVDAVFRARLDGVTSTSVDLGGIEAPLPRPLPRLRGEPLGDAPAHLAVAAGDRTGYALPVVIAPAIRTARGFWRLASLLEQAIAALVGTRLVTYVEPWPHSRRSARVLTCDLDDLVDTKPLAPLVDSGRPATLFCCSDALARYGAPTPAIELAAHGDVHRSFNDPETNLGRVDRMLGEFLAAGHDPRGFSPPNLAYNSPLAPLFARFEYLRLGFQERGLRFFPTDDGGVTVAVSYYTDFLQRYVGAEEYGRLLGRFCRWAAASGVLAVPCIHPAVWPASLRACLESVPADGVWETTLAEVAAWWTRRRGAIAALGRGEVPPADVVVRESTPAARLAALEPPEEETHAPTARGPASVVTVSGRGYRVLPAAEEPSATTEVPLSSSWQGLDWLPRGLRGVASRALVQVANRSGLHACYYRDLGLTPEIHHGSVHLPLTAPEEPLILTHPVMSDLRRLARQSLGRGTPDA
jgi:hypothetical protein